MSSFKTKKIYNEKNNYNRRNFINQEIKEKKSWKNFWKKILKIFLAIILFVASATVIVFAVYKWKIAEMNIGSWEEFRIFNPIIFENKEEKEEKKEKWVKNILIGGIGGAGHPGWELTDSIIVASLNYDQKTVTLLSVPRDLFVAHSKNSAWKINSLYPIGQKNGEGINYLAGKISQITGQEIHHYVVIDFYGFKKIVDALGGVTVNVPNKIYDREYPNENWWYEVFSLNAGVQNLDGATALKFVRSRHSTSDFDRSSRQQLLLRAMKDKALSLGIITSPTKIWEIIESVKSSLSTDLTVGDIVDMALYFKDIDNDNIIMYSINDQCNWACLAWAFLYTPPMALFGGQWVVIPEWATKSSLSKYDSIRRYVDTIFEYPHLKNQAFAIRIITNNSWLNKAKLIRKSLEQLGFPIEHNNVIIQTGATLWNSRINFYYDEENKIGYDENHTLTQSLKKIEPNIPISFVNQNEFSKNQTWAIEIIIWKDINSYFDFSKPVQYLAAPINIEEKTENKTENKKEETITPKTEKTENKQEKTEELTEITDILENRETEKNLLNLDDIIQ